MSSSKAMTPLVVEHGYLCRNGAMVPVIPTPNMSGLLKPEGIVLHDTAGPTSRSATEWMRKPENKVSAHVVIETDGTIVQMVPFDRRAWHAGASIWNGRSDVNSFMIGIEIVNPGCLDKSGMAWFKKTYPDSIQKTTKEHGPGRWMPYPEAQVAAVIEVCRALIEAYPSINDPERITTHWYIRNAAIAAGMKAQKKVDTNPLFPLDEVRKAAFEPRTPKFIAAAKPAPEPAEAVPKVAPAVAARVESDEKSSASAEAPAVPAKPIVTTVKSSRTVFGVLLASIGLLLEEAKDLIAETASQVVSLAPAKEVMEGLGISAARIATVITVAGIAYALYARLHDAKTGSNVKER